MLSTYVFGQVPHFNQGHTTKAGDTLNTYYKMVTWDDSQYEQFTYYSTNVEGGYITEFMNYRVIFPNNYDPNRTPGYPMIVMLHGAGESGRSWSGRFAYDPTDPEYDNNGHQLLHGGSQHKDAVNRDPSDSRAFNGFVLFPQVSDNGAWDSGWDNGILAQNDSMAVLIIENLIDRFNINYNKIYVHGLSNGAVGTWDIISKRPDLFAAYLPMSGTGRDIVAQPEILKSVPTWIFQGGLDTNPSPGYTQDWVNALKAVGNRPRYYLYPTLGHGTWNTAYAEPDFFSWILSQDKRRIYVLGADGDTTLCPGGQRTLSFSAGFTNYQWTKDGVDITGENTRDYVATSAGIYTVKYDRSLNGQVINEESFPIEIIEKQESTFKPTITVQGSTALPMPSNGVGLILEAPSGYPDYQWYQDDVQLPSTSSSIELVPTWSTGNEFASSAGVYKLSVTEPSGCVSLVSDSVNISYGTGANPPNAPSDVVPSAISSTEANVVWVDNASNENYQEIWRVRYGDNGYAYTYTLEAIVGADVVSYYDNNTLPDAKYSYQVRAINNDGGNISPYNSASFFSPSDLQAPYPPTNLIVTDLGTDFIDISWDLAEDNVSVDYYNVYVGAQLDGTTTSTTYSITGLTKSTQYAISVQAVDHSGNASVYSNGLWVTTSSSTPGLTYNIYDGAYSVLPNFGSLTPTSTGVIGTFDISERDGDDNFAFTFDGYIYIQTPGTYTFSTASDDGSKLYIEGTQVVNNDGLHGTTTVSAQYVFSSSGYYAIRVTYFERTGGDYLLVRYSGADTGNTAIEIPSSVLFIETPVSFTTYYSDASGDLANKNNWGTELDGSGTSPSNFTGDYCQYIVSNRASTSLDNAMTISGTSSKMIVGSGVELTLNAALTSEIEVMDGAVLILNNTTAPTVGDCDISSTVRVAQNLEIPSGNYGNMEIMGGASATLPSQTTFIKGDLVVNDLSSLSGIVGNASVLELGGDVTFNASLAGRPEDELYALRFYGSGNHTLSVNQEDVEFFEIEVESGANLIFENNTTSQTKITLGSSIGGGLTLNGSSSFDIQENQLELIGKSYINKGIESGTISVLNGDISISTNALVQSNLYFDATDNVVNNLVIDNTSSKSINIANDLNVNNRLKITDGELNITSSIRLLGSELNTAYVDVIENNGKITGNVILERNIRAGRYWRYVATPFIGETIADWQNSIPITGNFTGASVIPDVSSAASLYYYDETIGVGDAGWVAYPLSGTDNTAVLNPGMGYAVFFRNDIEELKLEMGGNPVQNDFTFTLTADPTPTVNDPTNDGWNLVGNPYPSSITWDEDVSGGWTSNQINNVIWIRNNESTGDEWIYYDRGSGQGSMIGGQMYDGTIAPGQAFYVQVKGDNTSSLQIHELAKSSSQATLYRTSEPTNFISIDLIGESSKDHAVISLKSDYQDNYEGLIDGVKRWTYDINVFTMSSDDVPLTLNNLSDEFCSKTVKIGVRDTQSGNYSLAFNNLGSFDFPIDVKLIDTYAEDTVAISDAMVYPFEVTSDVSSYGNDRFVLKMARVFDEVYSDATLTQSCDGEIPYLEVYNTLSGVNYQAFLNDSPVSDLLEGNNSNLLRIDIDTTDLVAGSNQIVLKATGKYCDLPQDFESSYELKYINTDLSIYFDGEFLRTDFPFPVSWTFDGEVVGDENTNAILPEGNGVYSVEYQDGDCYYESDPFEYIIQSVNFNNDILESFVYPNPADKELIIDAHQFSGARYNFYFLYDTQGKLVKEGTLLDQTNRVEVGTLKDGLYQLVVLSDDKKISGKILIGHN